MEYNLVEIWLRKDPVRWFAGALAGLFAATLALGVAMTFSFYLGMDPWFPAKLLGTLLLGPSATDQIKFSGALAGGAVFGTLGLFWGVIFAHFTGTNSIKPLLAMGLVWGIFSWIFLWNLFMQSFRPIFAAKIPPAPVFPVCIAYGLALSSVAFFDSLLRGKKKSGA